MSATLKIAVDALATIVPQHHLHDRCRRGIPSSPPPIASSADGVSSQALGGRPARGALSLSNRFSSRSTGRIHTSIWKSASNRHRGGRTGLTVQARKDSQAPGDHLGPRISGDLHPELSYPYKKKNSFGSKSSETGWVGVNTNWWGEMNTCDTDEVYILLFGVGTGQEGVYSLQRLNEDGLPKDTVLAFAAQRDAERYAALLEDEMGQHAYVETIYTSELQEFCVEAGFEVRVVDNSAVILGFFRPPQQTVDVTDWERAVRLRAGMFTVCEEPFDESGLCTPMEAVAHQSRYPVVEYFEDVQEERAGAEPSDAELKRARLLFQKLYDEL